MSRSQKHVRFMLHHDEIKQWQSEPLESLIQHCSDNYLFYRLEDGYLHREMNDVLNISNIDIDLDENNKIVKANWHGHLGSLVRGGIELENPVRLNTVEMKADKMKRLLHQIGYRTLEPK